MRQKRQNYEYSGDRNRYQLPEPDFWKLADWITEFKNRQWDKQIERDAREGRLDNLINEAKEEIRQGKASPL